VEVPGEAHSSVSLSQKAPKLTLWAAYGNGAHDQVAIARRPVGIIVECHADFLGPTSGVERELVWIEAACAHIDAGCGIDESPAHSDGHMRQYSRELLPERRDIDHVRTSREVVRRGDVAVRIDVPAALPPSIARRMEHALGLVGEGVARNRARSARAPAVQTCLRSVLHAVSAAWRLADPRRAYLARAVVADRASPTARAFIALGAAAIHAGLARVQNAIAAGWRRWSDDGRVTHQDWSRRDVDALRVERALEGHAVGGAHDEVTLWRHDRACERRVERESAWARNPEHHWSERARANGCYDAGVEGHVATHEDARAWLGHDD